MDKSQYYKTLIEEFGEDWSTHNGAEIQEWLERQLVKHASELSRVSSPKLAWSESDDGLSGTLTLLDAEDSVLASIVLPAGSGAMTGIARTILKAEPSATTAGADSDITLSWTYGHTVDGEEDGATADVTIRVLDANGNTQLDTTLRRVSAGTYTLPIGTVLREGENRIYLSAKVTDPVTGEELGSSSTFAKVTILGVTLVSGFSLEAMMTTGGFGENETIPVPFTVSGAGTKRVTLYVDGYETARKAITRSGSTIDSFQIDPQLPGLHSLQIVAEVEQEGVTVRSASHYADFYVGEPGDVFTAISLSNPSGAISPGASPATVCDQYGTLSVQIASTAPTVEILLDKKPLSIVNCSSSIQTWTHRFMDAVTHTLSIGGRKLTVEVTPASYAVQTATVGLEYERLEPIVLRSGQSRSLLEVKPFAGEPSAKGMTLEVTFRTSGVVDASLPVLTCMEEESGKGLRITGSEVAYLTGQTVSYTNEEEEPATRAVKLSSFYPEDTLYKATLVIHPAGEGTRLMELYLNGDRVAADTYGSTFTFGQARPAGLSLSSEGADLEVRSVRLYSRALSDDECLENYIADITDTDRMLELYTANDILNDRGDDIDMTRLTGKSRGVLRIIRKGGIDDVFRTNNKSADFLADIIFESPFGSAHSFDLRNCYMRIQGTSSTLYPSKNLRIYLTKGQNPVLTVGGKVVKEWAIRPGATPVTVFCPKADYVDSSMSLNTGGAKLFNAMMIELGILTPPQQWQKDHGMDITVRQAIDGYPIDVFVSETETAEAEYLGQYNLNNEKSKSGRVFGMEGVEGFAPECPLALETLNNMSPVCLFDTASESELEKLFDTGCEVNYGIDASGKVAADGDCSWEGNPEKDVTVLGSKGKQAVRELWGWLRECKPAGADPADLSTFRSAKFLNELGEHFSLDNLCAYYLFTDYLASVDQRAKNMLLRTWDGHRWFVTYYDGDTSMGKRNDSFMAYLYNLSRTTWDAEMSKWAFEGHDSLLWNLLLGNCETDLRLMAEKLRKVLTNERLLTMFNEEQAGHWPTRAFNKSGYLKYIRPALTETYGKLWPFIYALNGSTVAHRTHFIRNRCALLDARWGVSGARDNNIAFYLNRKATDAADRFVITPTEEWVYGYGTNNVPDMYSTGLVGADSTAELSIAGAYTLNDPLRIYGADRIRTLDLRRASTHLQNGLDLNRCSRMETLDMTLPSGATPSGAWWLLLSGCKALRRLLLKGQTGARTSQSSKVLDLSAQTRLEELDLRDTAAEGVIFAPGAPLTKVQLPATLKSLTLDGHTSLTTSGLTLAEGTALEELTIRNCPNLDTLSIVQTALSAGALKNVTVEGVNWDSVAVSVLLALAKMGAEITGVVQSVSGTVDFATKLAMVQAWGAVDSEDNTLYVRHNITPIVSLSIEGEHYPTVGKWEYELIPDSLTGNGFTAVKWELAANPYATVDPTTGIVTVTSIGEEATGEKFTLTARLTLSDGGEYVTTLDLGIYEREVKIGDWLHADGTIADRQLPGKTAVAKCFYIDYEDKSRRLWIAPGTHSGLPWGISLGNSSGYNTSILVPEVPILADDPTYSTVDVPTMTNRGYPTYKVNNESHLFDNLSPDGYKRLDGAFSEIGWTLYDGVLMPWGKVNTLNIIRHRNKILTDSGVNLPIPAANALETEEQNLKRLEKEVVADTGLSYMKTFYYPAASRAWAYIPSIKNEETLHPKLGLHNWFMMSAGEVFRFLALCFLRDFLEGDEKWFGWTPALIAYNADFQSSTETSRDYCAAIGSGGSTITGGLGKATISEIYGCLQKSFFAIDF